MRHDNWKRRRQGLPPLTTHEKQEAYLEKEKASGYFKKAVLFHKDIIATVEKYAKEREMTRREAWNDIMRAGIAALKL
jgi:hypothetical protein